MRDIQRWFRDNVDTTQMFTLIVTSAVIGGTAFALRRSGFGKAASVVKGG